MARKKSLIIEILGNNKMGRAVRDAMGSLRRLGRFAGRVGRGIGVAFRRGAMAVAGLAAGMTGLAAIYAKQEQADTDLAAAIAKMGDSVDEMLPKLKAQAAAIQQETRYGDEFVQTLQAQAINMGIATDEATEATQAAMGLAKAYGLELTSAMRLVTRARVGDTATLKRYGIVLDDTLSTEEKYYALLRIGASNYQLVQRDVQTLSGRFAQFKNALGDVAEAIGGAFVEGVDLTGALEKMTDRAAEFGANLQQKLLPHFREFREIIEGIMAGGGERAEAIQKIKENWSRAMDVVGPKLEEWGAATGRAIWRGFKAAAKGTAKHVVRYGAGAAQYEETRDAMAEGRQDGAYTMINPRTESKANEQLRQSVAALRERRALLEQPGVRNRVMGRLLDEGMSLREARRRIVDVRIIEGDVRIADGVEGR